MQSQQLRAQLNSALQQQRLNQLQTAALSPPSSSQEPHPPTSPPPPAQRAEQTTPSSSEQRSVPQPQTRNVQPPSQKQPPQATKGQSAPRLNPQTPNARPPRNSQPQTPLGQALPPLPPQTPNTNSMPHLNSQTPNVQSRLNLPSHTRSQSILPINQEYGRYEHPASVANSESPSYHNPYSHAYDRRYDRHRYDYSRATDYDSEVFQSQSRRSHTNSARSTLFYIFVTIVVIFTPIALFNTDDNVANNMYDSAQSLFRRFDPRNAVNWSDTIIWKGPSNVLNKIRNESAFSIRSRRNYSYAAKPSNGNEKTSLWSKFVKNKLGGIGHRGQRDNPIPKGALDDSFTQDDDSWMNREEPISQDDGGFSIRGQHGGINPPTSVTPTPTPTMAYHLAQGNNEASVDSDRQYYPNFKKQFERNRESDNNARITARGSDGYGYRSQTDYLRQSYPLKHGTGNAIEMPSVPPPQLTLQMSQPHLYQPTRALTTPNSYQPHQWGHQSGMQLHQVGVWGPRRIIPSPSNFYPNGYGNQYSQVAKSHHYHNTHMTRPSRLSQPLATEHQVSGMSQGQAEHRGYSNNLLMPTPNPVGAIQFPHEQLQASTSLQNNRVEPHQVLSNDNHVGYPSSGYASSGYAYANDRTNQRRYPIPPPSS